MIKSLRAAALALVAAALTAAGASHAPTTQTNVLQNISIQLTVYQQGITNSQGTKVTDQVASLTTKKLIADLAAVTGINFGPAAKLVQSTVFSSVTVVTGPGVYTNVLTTDLALATNGYLSIGGYDVYNSLGYPIIVTISGTNITTGGPGSIGNNLVSTVGNPTNESLTINTNVGFITTFTPSTDDSGFFVTNVQIVTVGQSAPPTTESVLTNVASSTGILYGPTNALYPVTNYLSFSTNIFPTQIVVESGINLNTTNALTVMDFGSQTGFGIQGLQINYFTPTGTNNLILTLQGFVKQALKVDLLSARGTNRIYEDIFGASSTWNVNGFGYAGGTYTTNPTSVPIFNGYLTNASPIVVEGSVNVGFLKNLAQ